MTTEIIPLKPTLKQKRKMIINDAFPGMILLINGIAELMDPAEHENYALLNIIVGIAVIIAFRIEWKHGSSEKQKTIKWFEVIAGIVLIVEALNHFHTGKIFQPALIYFLIGIVIICRGIFHKQSITIRKLTCDNTGFILCLNMFLIYKMHWKDIAALELVKETLHIKTVKGKMYNVNLRRVENRDEIFETMKKYIANR
jgi:uncharacterized membrane protein HdeD (DUF308 family)